MHSARGAATSQRLGEPVPDVQLLSADLAPRAIHALTSDLIACRISAEIAGFVALRLPIPPREREQVVLALFRHDVDRAMRLLRQAITI